jgi:CspA family cold shock protein
MSRNKDYRAPRRRGFDDDDFSPRDRQRQSNRSTPRPVEGDASAYPSSAPQTSATVSWFNAEKGFGFVKASDGSDAFLHIRALEAAGHQSVSPGATLKVRLGQGLKGPQVMEVFEVDNSTAQAAAPERPQRSSHAPVGGPEMEGQGTVKWYNGDKGFGFIGLEGGEKDVFVHATVVARSGLAALNEGQKVDVKYAMGKKGPEAKSIQLRS